MQGVVQWVSHKKRWIDSVEEFEKKKEVWMSGKRGERCLIGVNGGGL